MLLPRGHRLVRTLMTAIIISLFLQNVSANLASSRRSLSQFNTQVLATMEVQAWQAYYQRDYTQLWTALIVMLTEQFHVSTMQATVLSGRAVRAAQLFAEMPRNTSKARYQREVLPAVQAFYQHLKYVVQADWDAQQVAQAELDWWVARRTPRKNNPQYVGQLIARVYSLLYGKSNIAIEKAGYLRAQAAHMRDQQRRRRHIDWKSIQGILEQSYALLLEGINEKT
ncbi:MAG: hypothetical protein Tsb005_15060 [Gammaproteobacteria bacterium]